MIEKKIHYIWFGGKPLPTLALKCIASWKKYCPDYEIIEWNEENFDVNSIEYTKQAYENKKWAFVSDYVRLYVLYNYGGIYMDTDVELLKPIDIFLENKAFSGFESYDRIQTGIMASVKNEKNISNLLNQYTDRAFLLPDNSLDLTTNVETITKYFIEKGIHLNNTFQVCNGFAFYPSDFFCPKDANTKTLQITDNTHAIHHFDGSWIPKRRKIKYWFLGLIGETLSSKLVYIKKHIKGGK